MAWQISDYLTVISIVLVVIGGIITIYQWRKTIILRRADYINELTEKIRTDEDIKNIIYLIDYSIRWYKEDFHNNNYDFEVKIDKTLSYFSYICYLKKKKLITKDEFKFFEYEITRILSNVDTLDYFYNLYHFSKANDVNFTFYYLFEYGKKNKFLDNDFYNKESYKANSKYHKYLNW